MRRYWFIAFISAICLEGLGRKYLPAVPSAFFYFLKDLVLIAGYVMMRPPYEVRSTAKWLYRGYSVFWVGAAAWTLIGVFNPESPSLLLAATGFRAYCLWWLAPVVVATALRSPALKRRAIYFVILISIGISILAIFQFASPADSAINIYSTVDGEEVSGTVAKVSSTGRARVSGTFSFLSGFAAFTTVIPVLLLSLGLETKDRKVRRLAMIGTFICAAVLPMSGSRSSVIFGGLVLIITAWSAGLFFTRVGRRVLIGSFVAATLAILAVPEAFEGVQSRFANSEETEERLATIGMILPPVAMLSVEYPAMGIGTGMQQNARVSMGVVAKYDAEIPAARVLIELGPIGYLLWWFANLGLMIALIRASMILKRHGRRAAAGAALSYAAVSFFVNSAFDHIAQALFFTACGFILNEVLEVLAAARAATAAAATATPSAPPAGPPGRIRPGRPGPGRPPLALPR